MANTFVGTNILFGTVTTSGTLTGGLGTLTLLQSAETSGDAKEELIADNSGNTKSAVYYDYVRKANLEWVVTDGAGTATGNLTLTTAAMPTAGSLITLTDASFAPISGSWIVRNEPTLTRSNTKAMMAKMDLVKFVSNTIPS